MVGDIHYILDLGLDLDLHRELINSSKRKKNPYVCVLSAANANNPESWNCETKWGSGWQLRRWRWRGGRRFTKNALRSIYKYNVSAKRLGEAFARSLGFWNLGGWFISFLRRVGAFTLFRQCGQHSK
jgi:hypothetical protein